MNKLLAITLIFILALGIVNAGKVAEALKLSLQTDQEAELEEKGYFTNASVSTLNCNEDECSYELVIQGEKKKTDTLKRNYETCVDNKKTDENRTVICTQNSYTDVELEAQRDNAITQFYAQEYGRITQIAVTETKGEQKEITT